MNNLKEHGDTELVIRPPSGFGKFDPLEYYRYRHMLISLVLRDIKSQFDEMHLGVVWAILRPLAVAVVFALFKSFSGANTYVHVPYPIFVYSGLIFWYYFTDATMQTAGSVRKDATIISKIYFPRLIIPMVPILSNLTGLAIAMVPLLMMMAWYQMLPGVAVLLLPLVLLQCMALAFGVGTLFAALTINNRDLEQFLSFLMYIGLFVSCVLFVPEMVPEWARPFVLANPMTGTLQALRACLFESFDFPVRLWSYSVVVTVITVLIGGLAFRRAEATFVDKL
jgi:lipopolysaccharide transport system permease protein